MRKLLIIALLTAGMSLAAQVTWTLQNVTFSDAGVATGSFVYDSSSNTVVSYSISVSGGNTATFPAWVYQNGTADNTQATAFPSNGVIDFETDLLYGGHARVLVLPVLPLPATGGVVNLNLTNAYGAECYNCAPFRTFASGQVSGSTGTTTTVPTLYLWALAGLALLLLGCGAALLSRLPESKPAR